MASVKLWENFDIIRVLLGIYMVDISCIFDKSLCCHNCYEIILFPIGSAVKNPSQADHESQGSFSHSNIRTANFTADTFCKQERGTLLLFSP